MNNCQHFWSSNAGRQECLFCRVTRQAPVEAPAPAQLTQDDEKHKWNEQGDKPWTCVRCGLFTANLRHIEYGFCRHKWTHRLQLQGQKLTCCGRCGVVKNERNPEKPCIGKVFIETRAPRPAQPAPPAEPSGEVPEWMKAAARECMAKFIAWPPVVNTAVDIFYKHYAADAPAPRAEPSVAEVLPCPFCGCLSHLHEHDRIFNGGDVGYRVECEGTCHSMTCYWHTREQALEVWNRRAAAPSPAISEPPTTMSEFQAATNADAILRSLDGYKSCPKCGTEWLAGEGVGCPTCQPAISEEEVARRYFPVHEVEIQNITGKRNSLPGVIIDLNENSRKVCIAAIREVSGPLRERVRELEKATQAVAGKLCHCYWCGSSFPYDGLPGNRDSQLDATTKHQQECPALAELTAWVQGQSDPQWRIETFTVLDLAISNRAWKKSAEATERQLELCRERLETAERLIAEVLCEFINHRYVPVAPMPTDGSCDTRWMKEAEKFLRPTALQPGQKGGKG